MTVAEALTDQTHLLNAVKQRGQKQTEFNYGILTADRYVKTVELMAGLDTCYKFGAKGNTSYHDIVQKASNTLVYSNSDMTVQEKNIRQIEGIEFPKNTLMVFRHVLTTPRKDRDGDVLRTEGAFVDPKMLLLWQHIPTLPIGKMLAVYEHNSKKLEVISCVVDMNELCHDAAVMIDNKMGRYSHGFRALEFFEMKEEQSDEFGPAGFEVTRFEIMEESLVSIPANVDAETGEVLVSLVEGGKLTSGIMKEVGKTLRAKMPVTVGYTKALEGENDEDKSAQLTGGLFPKERRANGFGELGTPDQGETTSETNGEEKSQPAEVKHIKPRELKKFDVELEHVEASKLEYEWASRWLSCQVKEMAVVHTFVPTYRKGSFLSGVKVLTKDWELRDTRNLTHKGTEEPPFYEVVQLNSRLSDTFLVDGMEFLKTDAGEHICVKRAPCYGGMQVITYIKRGSEVAGNLINEAWDWAYKNNFLKGEAFSLSGDFIKRTSTKWDDVFLEEKNEKALKRSVKQLNEKQTAAPSRGIISMGPPGTGKTLSGRVILNEAKASFIWLAAKDFWQMGAVGGICSAFELAQELAPAVVFIEDVDNWMSDYAVDVIKTEMDGIQKRDGILTILTTNYPERLPDALIDRPGRFHDVLMFDLPTASVRLQMLAKWAEGAEPTHLRELVKITEGYSGAHIYELVSFAKSLKEEEDGLSIGDALVKAVEKINEQRELIDQSQLSGSRYNGRRESSPQVKSYLEKMTLTYKSIEVEPKAGRSLSKENQRVLKDCCDDLDEVMSKEGNMSRGSMALCKRCRDRMHKMCDDSGSGMEGETSVDVREAMAIFLSQADDQLKAQMKSILNVMG